MKDDNTDPSDAQPTDPVDSSDDKDDASPAQPVSETSKNPKEPLESFDWEDLEQRYEAKMQEFESEEQKIYEDFDSWMKLFQSWADTTITYENDRSYKRLKTRISYVQGSERKLEEKRQHHLKVVKAFESALALLGQL